MELVRTITANPNTQAKCQWFKSSVREVDLKFPNRLKSLVEEIKNGVNSVSENTLSLKEHIHIQVDDYVSWNKCGRDLNELVVHVTVFS